MRLRKFNESIQYESNSEDVLDAIEMLYDLKDDGLIAKVPVKFDITYKNGKFGLAFKHNLMIKSTTQIDEIPQFIEVLNRIGSFGKTMRGMGFELELTSYLSQFLLFMPHNALTILHENVRWIGSDDFCISIAVLTKHDSHFEKTIDAEFTVVYKKDIGIVLNLIKVTNNNISAVKSYIKDKLNLLPLEKTEGTTLTKASFKI